jgi:hypothetical protein
VREVLRLAATLALPPVVVEIIKSLAAVGGWPWQVRKAERAKVFLLGLYERLERTRFEYTKRDDFPDLFEEVLRRISEQPDDRRRDTMRAVFLKIIEEPRDHVENKLLVRLADELPSEVLRALSMLHPPLTKAEIELKFGRDVLAARMSTTPGAISTLITYLRNENLAGNDNDYVHVGIWAAGNDLMFLLTPLGRTFVEYARG